MDKPFFGTGCILLETIKENDNNKRVASYIIRHTVKVLFFVFLAVFYVCETRGDCGRTQHRSKGMRQLRVRRKIDPGPNKPRQCANVIDIKWGRSFFIYYFFFVSCSENCADIRHKIRTQCKAAQYIENVPLSRYHHAWSKFRGITLSFVMVDICFTY